MTLNPLNRSEINNLKNPLWKDYFLKWGDPTVYGEWVEPNTTGKLNIHKEYFFINRGNGSPIIDTVSDTVEIKENVQSSSFERWLRHICRSALEMGKSILE